LQLGELGRLQQVFNQLETQQIQYDQQQQQLQSTAAISRLSGISKRLEKWHSGADD